MSVGLSQPLAGRRIAVLRAADDGVALAERLAALGAATIVAPAIARVPTADHEPLDSALANLDRYSWVVFTSPGAVQPFVERLEAVGRARRVPDGTRLAALGPGTASKLARFGFDADHIPVENNAMALARLPVPAGGRVLLLVGDLADDRLSVALAQRQALVDRVIVYRTVADPAVAELADPLRRGEIDAIALTSPSTLSGLLTGLASAGMDEVEARRSLMAVDLVAIGATTASALTRRGLRAAAVADPQTLDGLVAALCRLAPRRAD